MFPANPLTPEFFYKTALEYYVSGRAAAQFGCVFTTGNLLHHAVELMLKGELCKTASLEDLAGGKKFGHWLRKCWKAFKPIFPAEDLTEFDPMIAELDKFEQIRYPDKLLSHGASIGFGFGRGRIIDAGLELRNTVPTYQMGIGDVDAFFATAIRMYLLNPGPYFSFLTEQGREALQKENAFAKDWLSWP